MACCSSQSLTLQNVHIVSSEDFTKAKKMKSARLDCLVLLLVCVDVMIITHQIALDLRLEGSSNSSFVFFSIQEAGYDVNSDYQTSYYLFTAAILSFSCFFLVEVIARVICNKINSRQTLFDLTDAFVVIVSFVANVALFAIKVNPILRDVVSLLIIFRFCRFYRLASGLTGPEKKTVLGMLEAYRREEIFSTEKVQMLQTELQNREMECADLRDLITKATRSRVGKQKRDLQSTVDPKNTRDSGHYDSGNSSDSGPDSPQQAAKPPTFDRNNIEHSPANSDVSQDSSNAWSTDMAPHDQKSENQDSSIVNIELENCEDKTLH